MPGWSHYSGSWYEKDLRRVADQVEQVAEPMHIPVVLE